MAKQKIHFRLRLRSNLLRRPQLTLFLVLFATVSSVLLYFSLASGIPIVRDNAVFWRPRIARCESGSNYSSINSAGYYGAYQFDNGTWSNYQGYARADQAPPAVQDAKFNEVFARRGSQPWNSSYFCWSRGTSIVTPPPAVPVFIPKLSTFNVTVTGTVTINNAPAPNISIDTCGNSPDDFKTDAAGNYSFIVASGRQFCIRITGGLPPNAQLIGTVNNPEHETSPSYEFQVPGENDYHSLLAIFSPVYSWDRSVDAGYNFAFRTI